MIPSKGLDFMMRLQISECIRLQTVREATRFVLALWMICGTFAFPQTSSAADTPISSETDPLYIKSGSLLICGGGVLPSKLMDKFVELGGGPQARVVIV